MGQIMPIISTGLQIFGMMQGGKSDEVAEEPKVEEEKKSLLFSPRKATKSATGTLISGVQ